MRGESKMMTSYLLEGSEDGYSPMEAACACLVLYENFASLVDEHDEIEFQENFLKAFVYIFSIKNEELESIPPPNQDED